MNYYSNPDILEALVLQCKNKEVFLKGINSVSHRPLKAENKDELLALIKKYNFEEPYGIFSSIELYDNPLNCEKRIGWDFAIDLDGDNLDQVKNTLKNLINLLKIFNIESFRIKFSGRRGFHIIIPGEAFNIFQNETDFINAYPNLPKSICQFLEASLKKEQKIGVNFDYSIYQPRRLLRLAYSLHEESYLVSLPLFIDEIHHFKLEDSQPGNVKVDWGWLNIKPKIGEGWDLLEAVSKWVKRGKDEAPAIKIIKPLSSKSPKRYEWIENLFNKPVDDGRHRILWLIIAPYLVNIKTLKVEEAEKMSLEYLERCNNKKRVDRELKNSVRYYLKYAKDRNLKPLSLTTLKEKYYELYEIIFEKKA